LAATVGRPTSDSVCSTFRVLDNPPQALAQERFIDTTVKTDVSKPLRGQELRCRIDQSRQNRVKPCVYRQNRIEFARVPMINTWNRARMYGYCTPRIALEVTPRAASVFESAPTHSLRWHAWRCFRISRRASCLTISVACFWTLRIMSWQPWCTFYCLTNRSFSLADFAHDGDDVLRAHLASGHCTCSCYDCLSPVSAKMYSFPRSADFFAVSLPGRQYARSGTRSPRLGSTHLYSWVRKCAARSKSRCECEQPRLATPRWRRISGLSTVIP
jgi:hypothetical protein